MESLRAVDVSVDNFFADCIRRALGVGPRWKMHLGLARKLVDKKSLFMIPLVSGMQTPIFDAIDYLVAQKDKSSIARLEDLFDSSTQHVRKLESRHFSLGSVTYIHGPQDYIPEDVQCAAVRALMALYNHEQASDFVARAFSPEMFPRLALRTVRELLAFTVKADLYVPDELTTHAFEYLQGVGREQKRVREEFTNRNR